MKKVITHVAFALALNGALGLNCSAMDAPMVSTNEDLHQELFADFQNFYRQESEEFQELRELISYINFEEITSGILDSFIRQRSSQSNLIYNPYVILFSFIRGSLEDIYSSDELDREERVAEQQEDEKLEQLNYDESRFVRFPRPLFRLTENLNNLSGEIVRRARAYEEYVNPPRAIPAA